MHCDIRTRLCPLFNTTAQVQGRNLTHAQWDASFFTSYTFQHMLILDVMPATCFKQIWTHTLEHLF